MLEGRKCVTLFFPSIYFKFCTKQERLYIQFKTFDTSLKSYAKLTVPANTGWCLFTYRKHIPYLNSRFVVYRACSKNVYSNQNTPVCAQHHKCYISCACMFGRSEKQIGSLGLQQQQQHFQKYRSIYI